MMEGSDLDRTFRALWWRSTTAVEGASPEDVLPPSFWMSRIAQLGLSSVVRDEWATGVSHSDIPLSSAGRIMFRTAERGGGRAEKAVLEIGSAVVLVSRHARGRLSAAAAARTEAGANEAISHLRSTFPKELTKGPRVAMTFWSYMHGASSFDETLDVCTWAEIAGNYPGRTRADLVSLMQAPDMTAGPGKIVLWLGPPGTGKTYALRALAWEQRERISIHCILDPEMFLDRIDYLIDVFGESSCFEDDSGDEHEAARLVPRTRLVVLEDAGELLGADARSRAGQGLSRLLNLTDGLPGQATRTRVLITTNEDVGRLHPAVTRPGRCGSLVRFAPLDETEVGRWLRDQGRDDLAVEKRSPSTIADLFALARGDHALPTVTTSVGFGRRH